MWLAWSDRQNTARVNYCTKSINKLIQSEFLLFEQLLHYRQLTLAFLAALSPFVEIESSESIVSCLKRLDRGGLCGRCASVSSWCACLFCHVFDVCVLRALWSDDVAAKRHKKRWPKGHMKNPGSWDHMLSRVLVFCFNKFLDSHRMKKLCLQFLGTHVCNMS